MLFRSVLDAPNWRDPGARVEDSMLDGDSTRGICGVSRGDKGRGPRQTSRSDMLDYR